MKNLLLGIFLSSFCLAQERSPQSLDGRKWEETYRSDDPVSLVTYRLMIPGTGFFAVKGKTELNAPLGKVLSILTDQSHAPQWVDALEESRVLERKSSFDYTEYRRVGTPFFVKDRDFVVRVQIESHPRERAVWITARSKPGFETIDSGAVRGEVLLERFSLAPGKRPNTTQVDLELHVDPKGSVPPFYANWYQGSWARRTLERLRDQASRSDLPLRAEFQGFCDITRTH